MGKEDVNNVPLAPNGAPSNLSPEDWAYVRSEEFKAWAGDWEKAARVRKLRNSDVLVARGDENEGKYELNNRSAERFIKDSLRGEYTNLDTGDKIRISARGAEKVTRHDAGNVMHLKSVALIPEMIKRSIFVSEERNEKEKTGFERYRYYVLVMKIDGEDYTAKLVVGVAKDNKYYYDHALSGIEKGNLLDVIDGIKRSYDTKEEPEDPKRTDVLSGIKDKSLISILQTNSSVVLDENGEPKSLYHGSIRDFEEFDMSHAGENTGLTEYVDKRTGEKVLSDSHAAIFFTDNEPQAVSYALLGRHGEICDIHSTAQDVASSLRSGTIGGFLNSFKTKDDFLAGVAKLVPFVPSLANLPPRISALSQEERDALAAPVWALRDEYAAYEKEMARGGMSNQYNNTLRQGRAVESLIGDFDRLRKNDDTVCGEFGPLSRYNISVYGASGNSEVFISLDEDSRRVTFRSPQTGPLFLDSIDDAMAEKCKYVMRHTHAAAVRRFNAEVQKGGYSAATRVYRCFLKAERPFEHDYGGSAFPDKYLLNEKYSTAYIAARQVRKALRDGNDMVVYRNVRDPFTADSYGVFSGDQVLIREVRKGVHIEDPLVRREDESRALMLDYGIPEKTADFILDHGEGVVDCDTYPRRSTPESPYDPACGTMKMDVGVYVLNGAVFVKGKDGRELGLLKDFLESGRKRDVNKKVEAKRNRTIENSVSKGNGIKR